MDDVRIYNMKAMRICQISSHAFLRKWVLDFIKAVFGVMTWATSELVDEGATGLAMEIRKAADYVVRNASKAYFTSLSI